ncbi:MAG: EAL domain-containing protein [Pseudomonadota bacterium]
MSAKFGLETGPADDFYLARRMTTPVWVFDTDHSRIAYANEAACRVWKAKTEADLRARDLGQGMSRTVTERLRQYQVDFLDTDAVFSEFWTIYPRDEPVTLKIIYSGFLMPDGRMAMQCEAVGTAEEEPATLRSADALLHTDVMIALYGLDGEALYRNPAARKSAPASDALFGDLFVDAGDYEAARKIWTREGDLRRVFSIRTGEGPRWLELSIKRCLDAATGDEALLVTSVDVSALKSARDEATYLASRDQLTGCYNRAFVQREMERAATRDGRAFGTTKGMAKALLYLDIDYFKQINDTYGHDVGDTVLRVFAKRIGGRVRETDVVARMGGDEFVIVLNDIANEAALLERLDAIQTSASRPIRCGDVLVETTTSIGVTLASGEDRTPWAELMRQADIALYESKRAGRDRFTLFDASLGAEAAERKWLDRELKKAIETDAFVLYLQPRLDLRSKRVASAEGLLRWEHPERGFIPPDTFIPACEALGLMDELGAFVLREAVRLLSAWHAAGLDLGLSINVSPKQFQDPDFLARFEAIAQDAAFPPDQLELEITESSLVGDGPDVARKIRRIDELGFRLALDDFGTGFSNLVHISQIPVCCIKMDKSFIQGLPQSAPLLSLVITLARQIGAETVAEGVEDEAQLQWLAAKGCDQIQGFLFSKAVPQEDLAEAILRIEAGVENLLPVPILASVPDEAPLASAIG